VLANTSALAQSYPETVRIGLYYGSSAVSSVALSAKAELEVGYYQNGQFFLLFAEEGGKQVIARKDTYFVRSSSGVLTEYNPNSGQPVEGETIGPFHIQIGDKLVDLTTAQNVANGIRELGVIAYPAYDGGWAVWTGFYSDQDKAAADIQNLAASLGIEAFTVVAPASNRIILYNQNFEPRMILGTSDIKLAIRPGASNNPKVLSVNGKQYRGEIEIRRFSDSDMTVINVLNIEEYLYGVVPSEIEAYSPIEAIKAQAVAARTYTYMNMGKNKKWDFDLRNTVDDQVYSGYDIEKPTSNQAVDETKGKKVLYNGQLASVFYFSSSGGMTEDNVYVWGTPLPYLVSVPDPYEAGNSYNYNWSRTFTAADIKKKLLNSGVDIGDVVSMTVEEYTPAGRVNKLKITGTTGSITYQRENIRLILGDNGYLPSRMFTISTNGASTGAPSSGNTTVSVVSAEGQSTLNVFGSKAVSANGISDITSANGSVKVVGATSSTTISSGATVVQGDVYVLTGKGWGHGVGMSQEGAKGFARIGYTYDQILKHYFTGVTVE
jgi:stage II sporulation protein D